MYFCGYFVLSKGQNSHTIDNLSNFSLQFGYLPPPRDTKWVILAAILNFIGQIAKMMSEMDSLTPKTLV
jgi:hypothetical protein